MATKIDYKSHIGNVIKTEKYGIVDVLDYQRDEKKHLFEVCFRDTKNVDWFSWTQLKSEKMRDKALEKKISQRKKIANIKKRNRIMKMSESKFSKDNNSGNVLSIDFATKEIGISYWSKNKHVKSAFYEANENPDFRERTNEIVDYLLMIIEKTKTDTVLLEDIYLGFSVDVLAKLAEARGFLIRELINRKIRYEVIPANTVRSALKAPTYREDIKQWAIIVFTTETNIYTISHDMADSYCQAKYFCGDYPGGKE